MAFPTGALVNQALIINSWRALEHPLKLSESLSEGANWGREGPSRGIASAKEGCLPGLGDQLWGWGELVGERGWSFLACGSLASGCGRPETC